MCMIKQIDNKKLCILYVHYFIRIKNMFRVCYTYIYIYISFMNIICYYPYRYEGNISSIPKLSA